MEIRVYDPQLDLIGIIEEYATLLWTRKLYEPGNFQMKLPLTDRNVQYLKRGNIISKTGSKEAGVIELIEKTDTPKEKTLKISGRFLSSYMDRRVIVGTKTISGTSEVVMRKFLQAAAPIPLVELGPISGFTDRTQKQTTYKNLLTVETALAKASGHGYRFRPDFTKKKIFFEVYDGLDKSINQFDRPRVIFSDEYSNLNDVRSTESDVLYKNVAYIGGAGEGSDRVFVTIGDTESEGLERHEVFIDAKSIQKDEGMTDAQYRQLLIDYGTEQMSTYKITSSFDSTVNPMINFKYGIDYDLGDTVTVTKKSWDINQDLKITEIMEEYAGGKMTVIPTFGNPLPGLDWSDIYEQ